MSRLTLISFALSLLIAALTCAGQRLDESVSDSSDAVAAKPFDVGEINELDDIESENAIIPNNDEECAKLEDNGTLFCDFCIASRDHIVGQLRRALNQAVSHVFALFFKAFEKLNIDPAQVKQLEAEQEAELRKQAELADAKELDVKSKEVAKRENPIQFLLRLLRGLADKFAKFVIQKIEELQRRFGLDKLKFATGGACDMLETFDEHIRGEFIKTRNELASYAPDFKQLKLENIECITVRRLVKLKGICGVITRFTDPLRFLSRTFVKFGRNQE